jgi:hypothetical protein
VDEIDGVKDDFFSRGFFKVGNGAKTRFWEDTWLGKVPLAQQYPSLYNVVHHKNVTVAHVLAQTPLNISVSEGCWWVTNGLCGYSYAKNL